MPPKRAKPHTVMLIDDSGFDLKIISRIINHTGLFENVFSFQEAEVALEYIVDNLNNKEKLPQLILLDIQMPGMDGFEFAEQFAKLPSSFHETCILAMVSSTDDVTDFDRVRSNPHILTLIKKPLHPNTFAELVHDCFEI